MEYSLHAHLGERSCCRSHRNAHRRRNAIGPSVPRRRRVSQRKARFQKRRAPPPEPCSSRRTTPPSSPRATGDAFSTESSSLRRRASSGRSCFSARTASTPFCARSATEECVPSRRSANPTWCEKSSPTSGCEANRCRVRGRGTRQGRSASTSVRHDDGDGRCANGGAAPRRPAP